MILPSPFGGRWLEEPDEGRVFEIAYERVMRHACPSSVRFADSFPPRGSLFCCICLPTLGEGGSAEPDEGRVFKIT